MPWNATKLHFICLKTVPDVHRASASTFFANGLDELQTEFLARGAQLSQTIILKPWETAIWECMTHLATNRSSPNCSGPWWRPVAYCNALDNVRRMGFYAVGYHGFSVQGYISAF